MKHLKDHENFGDDPSHFPKDFGFSGSAEGGMPSATSPPSITDTHDPSRTNPDNLSRGTGESDTFARGGMHHMHPHGHEVTHVEHGEHGVIHHHAHGGYTMHHHDGKITHHAMGGAQMMPGQPMMGQPMMQRAMGGSAHEYAGGGAHEEERGEKRMMTKAIHEHEAHDHKGEKETDVKLAGGGRPRIPGSMKPAAMKRHSPLGGEAPVNKMPRNIQRETTPRNQMPGGSEGYGMEPSAEPDVAQSDQGISGMRKGGRHKG